MMPFRVAVVAKHVVRHSPLRALTALALLVAVAGCGGEGDESEPSALSKREVDSAIGVSGLPGATGIGRAITASDSIAARNARLDSLAREP